MGGQGESGLEGPVATDGGTDMTAEGGIGAAFLSTLGLTGSSIVTKGEKNDIKSNGNV